MNRHHKFFERQLLTQQENQLRYTHFSRDQQGQTCFGELKHDGVLTQERRRCIWLFEASGMSLFVLAIGVQKKLMVSVHWGSANCGTPFLSSRHFTEWRPPTWVRDDATPPRRFIWSCGCGQLASRTKTMWMIAFAMPMERHAETLQEIKKLSRS